MKSRLLTADDVVFSYNFVDQSPKKYCPISITSTGWWHEINIRSYLNLINFTLVGLSIRVWLSLGHQSYGIETG